MASKSYSEQYERMLREQLEKALDGIDMRERAQRERYEAQSARIEAARQEAMRGAYSDYAHNIDPYGIQAQARYADGLAGSGKSETALAAYYNTYQNALAQANSLKAQQETDLRLDLEDALAQNEAERTNVRTRAYNNILSELIRREQTQYDREKDERDYALRVAQDKRDSDFRIAQAKQEQENWQKEYEFKLATAAAAAAAKSGGSAGAGKSSARAGSGGSGGGTAAAKKSGTGGRVSDEEFEKLYNAMNSLRWSLLPGESNPTPRIREWQNAYLQAFAAELTAEQYRKLSALLL